MGLTKIDARKSIVSSWASARGLRVRNKDVTQLLELLDMTSPIPELNGLFPLTLYFGSEADRQEMVVAASVQIKNSRSIKLR
jgi:hypothetical protein